jgi:hypothetical protein
VLLDDGRAAVQRVLGQSSIRVCRSTGDKRQAGEGSYARPRSRVLGGEDRQADRLRAFRSLFRVAPR